MALSPAATLGQLVRDKNIGMKPAAPEPQPTPHAKYTSADRAEKLMISYLVHWIYCQPIDHIVRIVYFSLYHLDVQASITTGQSCIWFMVVAGQRTAQDFRFQRILL